ncbi:MAG: SH3 domain-containing protein [Treponema sp.]|nr:SH3 domain-containing protein [Treponema sp.]
MKKLFSRVLVLLSLCVFSSLFFSCNKKEGYSVVLWNIPEYNIQDCEVVPVYVLSHISQVYIIGSPSGEKLEVPLWQLTKPVSKSKALKQAEQYKEYAHKYASVKLDGLPCRAEPKNLSKQIYRLRKGETIKVLAKGDGDLVMAGKEALEGDWLKVLTKDGTEGWCFSHNLILFDMDASGAASGETEILVEEQNGDATFEAIFDKPWYPETFLAMINEKNIDTTVVKTELNFTIDSAKGTVSLNMPENKKAQLKAVKKTWDYSGYEKVGRNQYELTDIPITITTRKDNFIVVRYTGSSGKPQDFSLITTEEDLAEVIKEEKQKRSDAYAKIVSRGPNYASSSYGNLMVKSSGSFSWTDYSLLVPNVISETAKEGGTISLKYGIGEKLKSQYDGVLTFKFDGAGEVNFLFKTESDGLRLENATNAKFEEGMVIERSSSSLVIYFKANK